MKTLIRFMLLLLFGATAYAQPYVKNIYSTNVVGTLLRGSVLTTNITPGSGGLNIIGVTTNVGDMRVQGVLTVTDPTSLQGTLDVIDSTALGNGATITNGLNVLSGASKFTGALKLQGPVVFDPAKSGNGTLTVTQTNNWTVNTNADFTLTISGTASNGQWVFCTISNQASTNITVTLSPTMLEWESQIVTNAVLADSNSVIAVEMRYDTNIVGAGRWMFKKRGPLYTLLPGSNITFTTNGAAKTITIASTASSGFAAMDVQTNGVRVGLQTNINFINSVDVGRAATNNAGANKVDIQTLPGFKINVDGAEIILNWSGFVMNEEFLGEIGSDPRAGTYPWVRANNSGGTQVAAIAIPGEIGLYSLVVTNAGDRSGIAIGAMASGSANGLLLTNIEHWVLCKLYIGQTNDATDINGIRLGLASTTGAPEAAQDIQLVNTNGTWALHTTRGSSTTRTVSASNTVAGAWIWAGFHLLSNGTNSVAVMGATPTSLLSIATNNLTIPADQMINHIIQCHKIAGTSTRMTNYFGKYMHWVNPNN